MQTLVERRTQVALAAADLLEAHQACPAPLHAIGRDQGRMYRAVTGSRVVTCSSAGAASK